MKRYIRNRSYLRLLVPLLIKERKKTRVQLNEGLSQRRERMNTGGQSRPTRKDCRKNDCGCSVSRRNLGFSGLFFNGHPHPGSSRFIALFTTSYMLASILVHMKTIILQT